MNQPSQQTLSSPSLLRTAVTCVLTIVALFAAPAQTLAGSAAPPDSASTSVPYHPFDTLKSDVLLIFTDAGRLFAKPAGFHARDWYLVGGTVAGTAGLMGFADDPLRETMLSIQGTDGDAVADIGNTFGEILPGLALTGSLYTVGLVFNWPKIRVMGRHVGQSLGYSALVTTVLKSAFGRHRPFLNDGPFAFEGPFQFDDPFLSHPSGHTTVTFAIASSLAADIDNPWATVGLYSLASVTAISRMYSDRHWSSDVFLAAVLSSAIGYGTANLDAASSDTSDESAFFILPSPSGITVGYRW